MILSANFAVNDEKWRFLPHVVPNLRFRAENRRRGNFRSFKSNSFRLFFSSGLVMDIKKLRAECKHRPKELQKTVVFTSNLVALRAFAPSGLPGRGCP